MSMDPGRAAFRLAFEVSPIILTGGIATFMPGGGLPIIAITEALNFVDGLLSGASIDLDSFFAYWRPLPGTTLQEYQFGEYPFANQAVAANAIISQPLTVSMRMVCSTRPPGNYALKLATLFALKTALDQHCSTGGTFTVVTPSYFYTNMLLKRMTDASDGESNQPQNAWQFDFEQPLLTLNQAQSVQNTLMAKLSSGTQINGTPSWSGLSPTVGQPNTLALPSVAPSAQTPAGITSPFQSALPVPVQQQPLT